MTVSLCIRQGSERNYDSVSVEELDWSEERARHRTPNCSPGAAASAGHCPTSVLYTWMGQMQKTHFTQYNCVCDKNNADLEPKTHHQTPMTCTFIIWTKVLVK